MPIMRVKTRWNIPGAGTAYTILHFGSGTGEAVTDTEASNSTLAVSTFFNSIRTLLPAQVTLNIESDVEVIDVATGDLQGAVTSANRDPIVGGASGTANWAAPAGVCITWSTGGIRQVSSGPRRVRGRTFIVPLASSAYATDGTIDSSPLTTLNSAATALRGNFNNQQFVIYGRPGLNDTPPGVVHSVTGHRITDQVAILRSRRN
jgi:hypothetical protein